MRPSMSLVSSTGESLRLRKSLPTSSMDGKARSVSFMGVTLNHSRRYPDSISWQHTSSPLKKLFLMAQVSESADVRDNECETELVLCTYLSEVDAPILDGESAAAPVVTHLDDLVLQRLVFEIVAETGNRIKTSARFAAVADQRANLVRKRLLKNRQHWRRLRRKITEHRIVIQAEESSGGKEFPIRLHLQQRADGNKSLDLGIVLKDLLQIVRAAGSNFEIADDRRPVAGAKREGERRDGIECLEDVALAIDDGAAKRRIKVMFLDDAP